MKTKLPVAFFLVVVALVSVIWLDKSRAQVISQGNAVQQGGNATLNSLTLATPLPPNSGGVGAMTNAPMWARNYGDGSSSTGPASGAIASWVNYTTWHCTGAITLGAGVSAVVHATGAVNLDTGCTISETTGNGVQGDVGGGGGSGGKGTADSAAALASNMYASNPLADTVAMAAAGGASSGGAGNDGGVVSASNLLSLLELGPMIYTFNRGGAFGGAGGSSGGAAGRGGAFFAIIAPSLTIASGVPFNMNGLPGVQSAANTQGGGGGGGGGVILFVTPAGGFTDNGGVYNYNGGAPGMCQQPSIQVGAGGCDTTGCGKDAVITIAALSSGGISAGANMTLTSAGTGYKNAPPCIVNAGTSGLNTSPACHFAAPIAGALALPIVDAAGANGTLTNYTTCFIGGFGGNGWYKQLTIQ